MAFWQQFKLLCEQRGKAPSTVAKEIGFSTGSISNWKNGTIPKGEGLQKIANYFTVTTDYLLTGQGPQAYSTSDEESEIFEAIRLLQDRRIRSVILRLRWASPEELRKINKMLDLLDLGDGSDA